MAKTTAEYFSHDTDASLDEKIIYLESLFGDSGYAWFFKMLETLGRSNGFEIEWSELKCGVLARKFNTTQQEFNKFIVAATNPDVRAFVIENGKLYSPGLKNRLEKLLDRRRKEAERIAEKRAKYNVGATSAGVAATSSQSKVKESKVKESKEERENAHAEKAESKPVPTEKNNPSPGSGSPLPVSASHLEDWIESLTTDYKIKEGFCLGYKIPESLFPEYVQRFPAVARAAPEKYYRRADLTGHFLNWSAIQYAKDKGGPSANSKPPQRATIQAYANERPELYEKQKF